MNRNEEKAKGSRLARLQRFRLYIAVLLLLTGSISVLSQSAPDARAGSGGTITLYTDSGKEGEPNFSAVKGNLVTVVCRVSSAAGVLESDFYVDYNSSLLTFVEGGPKASKETGGIHIQSLDNTDSPVRRTFSLKFMAAEEGECPVFIRSGARVVDGDGNPISLQTASIIVTIPNDGAAEPMPDATLPVVPTPDPAAPMDTPVPTDKLSGNCRVRSLLTNAIRMAPAFDPEVTQYDAEVKSDTTIFFIDYVLAGKKSRASIKGNRDLTYGVNKVTLTVTAENGKKKKYVFLVNRLTKPEKQAGFDPAVSGGAVNSDAGLDKEENNGYSIVLYIVIALLAVFGVAMIILVKRQQRELQYYYEEEEEKENSRETEDDRGSGESDFEGREVRGQDGEFRYRD